MTQNSLPDRLKRPTVEEAIFEVRFVPQTQSVVGLLPGILFTKLGTRYTKHEAQALATLPPEFRANNPELKYAQQVRLSAEDNSSLFVGDWVAGASSTAPYLGWLNLKQRIVELVEVLQESRLIRSVERVSFKYVNIVPLPLARQMDALKLAVRIADETPPPAGFRLRAENNSGDYRRIFEFMTGVATTRPNGEHREGLLVSLDAIMLLPAGGGVEVVTEAVVEAVHLEAKRMFFGVITDETLAELAPEYEVS